MGASGMHWAGGGVGFVHAEINAAKKAIKINVRLRIAGLLVQI
jgi:hypothetical protein